MTDTQQATTAATTTSATTPTWQRRGEGFLEWTTPFASIWPHGKWIDRVADPSRETVYDIFVSRTQTQPQKDFLGWREREEANGGKLGPYRWLSWSEAGTRVAAIGSGLAGLGVAAPGDRVGIFAPNCPDWVLCEYAAFRQSLVVVPVYPTCGSGTINTIVRHAGLGVVFCHATLLAALLEDLTSNDGGGCVSAAVAPAPIRVIVLIGNGVPLPQLADLPEKSRSTLAALGARVVPLAELIAAGTAAPLPAVPPKPDDPYSIVYTSGCTGEPKGVILSHRNVLSAVETFVAWPSWKGSIHEWTYFSYLPLAHVFEREVSCLIIRVGARIGFSSGLANLVEDMGMIRPEFIVGVPRVWKKIADNVASSVAKLSFIKRAVFNLAVSRKMACVRSGVAPWIDWDGLVLHTVAEKLGGRLRFVINGAAAVDPALSLWFQSVFNVVFYQGYGLTETYAAIAVQHLQCCDDKTSVGPPMPGAVVRLVDVPEMGYLSTDTPPRGEIWLKGPMVAHEYYHNEEATATAFKPDGFFASGDIGKLNPDGTITIIDRKKNLFKLAQGEYIALEYIETVYARCKDVAQIWIWGDPLSNFLLAIVVPNIDVVRAEMKAAGVADLPESAAELCADARARKHVLERMDVAASEAKLLGFQRVKAVLLEHEPWTIEANQLTPTFKVRRTELQKKYAAQLAELSAQHKLEIEGHNGATHF